MRWQMIFLHQSRSTSKLPNSFSKEWYAKRSSLGEKLPSVRELAVETQVNPNTIQRTYNEMERMGIVETRRGQGTFVVEKSEVIDDLKREMQAEVIGQFVLSMEELGLSKQDMLSELDRYLQKGDPNEH